MPRICESKREQIVVMSKAGDSQRKIAKHLNISRCSVQKCLQRYSKYQTVNDCPRSGAPKKLSRRTERKIVLVSKSEPFLTAREIQNRVPESSNVCIGTVKRILRRNGLFGRVAARKPLLSKQNIQHRKKWCVDKKNWTDTNWSKVIFSDETRLELIFKSRKFVRRQRGQRFLPKIHRKLSSLAHI